ncbi:hypothetical protein TUM4261_21090 [Shewanella sp. c952]|uniref:hypothetical protein n=1 Tax=Shewanella sp. c952 TaxID=2815913 RepID=UPI001BC6D883|nr:hypothetical protein [Shewanella sp. c952]GIU10683.1 hypothetical protein TUM4261_21090 [Shewanella sp. c952]
MLPSLPFDSPFFWACNVLLFMLLPMVYAMLFGNVKDRSNDKVWAYREAGVEIAFVLFPFLLYSIAHLLNSSFQSFLLSPELPMAAMIIAGIAMFSLLKGASSAQGKLPVAGLLVFQLCFMALFMSCAALVFWLTLAEEISEWFSVLNSFVAVLSLLFSYGTSAAMNYVVKHPDKVVTAS